MTATTGAPAAPAVVRLRALGTEAVLVVSDPAVLGAAEATLHRELQGIDRACSRFRSDAEIAALTASGGRWVKVSALLFEALSTARQVARLTNGAVDPTVGAAMASMGYDTDFSAVAPYGPPTPQPVPAPGWRMLELDHARRRARLPAGVRLDLGASAKALAADRVAAGVAALGSGVVVSIGGDVAVGGPAPDGGWSIGIAADSSGDGGVDEVLSMAGGGLASSSTAVRSWVRGARRVHHILDPRTGDSVTAVWQLVTVAATSCVEANAFSTAAMVWGTDAPERLEQRTLAARLVGHVRAVVLTSGWPPMRGIAALADR